VGAIRRAGPIILLALLTAFAFPNLQPPAVAAPRVSGNVVAKELRHGSPATRPGTVERLGAAPAQPDSGATGGDTLAYTSEIIDAGQRFNYVGVHWRARRGAENALFFEVRASRDGVTWSDWDARYEEEDMRDPETNEVYAAPLNVGDARYLQYRVWATNGDLGTARSVGLTLMDVSDLNASPISRFANDLFAAVKDLGRSFEANAAIRSPTIRTRQDWGCFEQCESAMNWIPQYAPWKKGVIHHTVTSNTYTDTAAEIRAIWYYHAFTRGWTDIGYNFVVDRFGQIWQGRQGGDDAAGGHALGWNLGSMGVAALGDFSNVTPSGEQLGAIAQLLAMKFTQRGIEVFGADTFTHNEQDANGNWVPVTTNAPNILGHRDCSFKIGIVGGQTACPGQALYNQIQNIKSAAQAHVNQGYTSLVHYTTTLPEMTTVGQTITVPVTVKNVGRSNVPAGYSVSYRVISATSGRQVVAQGPNTALPGALAPGASVTVNARVDIPATPGRYIVRWDLFAAGTGWFSSSHGASTRDEWMEALEWNVEWLSDNTPPTMVVGRPTTVNVTVRNTGAHAWPASAVRLAYHWFTDSGALRIWDGDRSPLPSDVQPNAEVTVPVTVFAPPFPGSYLLQFDVVYEGQFWFSQRGANVLEKRVAAPFDFSVRYGVPASVSLPAGLEATVPVSVTNAGTTLWPSNGRAAINLGTHWYRPDGSIVEWDGLRTPLPQDLAPGQTVTVQARVRAPSAHGTYQLRFDMVYEGLTWFSSQSQAMGSTAATSRAPIWGARYEPGAVAALSSGQRVTVPVVLTNTGELSWPAGLNLAYHVYDSANRLVTWDGARTALPSGLAPGQAVTVQAQLVAPLLGGTYSVRWDVVQENVSWFSQRGVTAGTQSVAVDPPTYAATYDASNTATTMPTAMPAWAQVTVTNGSNFDFTPSSRVSLSYHWYDGSGRVVVWDGRRTALDLPRGQSATVNAEIAGPPAACTCRLAFDLVQEGVTWFSTKGVATADRTVNAFVPEYGAVYGVPEPRSAGLGQTITVPVTVTNTGTRTWSNREVFVSYHLYRGGALYVWDGARTSLPASLAPGQSVTVNATIRVPTAPATYEVRFDLVHELVAWFSQRGVPIASLALTAQ